MFARWNAASRLLLQPARSAWSTSMQQKWLHISPTLHDDNDDRQQELAKLRQDLENLVTKGRDDNFAFNLPDFVEHASVEQLARMRATLAKAEASQRVQEFDLLQRDLDLIEAQGKHFYGLEVLRAQTLKEQKTTRELVLIREELRRRLDADLLPLRHRPVMENGWIWDDEHVGEDEEDAGAANSLVVTGEETPPVDKGTMTLLTDAQLSRRPFNYLGPWDKRAPDAPKDIKGFGEWLEKEYQEAIEGLRVVKRIPKEDGTSEEIDLGPATERDLKVYGQAGYRDPEDQAILKADSDIEVADPHPFGGSRLPAPPSNPRILGHPLDHAGFRPDVAAYLLRREVVINLTHELDEKGEDELADMITEELKDRDFEIIGRLLMQERAAEASLLMESVMAGQDFPDHVESISRVLSYDQDMEDRLARRRAARLEAETSKKVIEQEVDQWGRARGTGRRKASVAVVSVWPGSGTITINNRPLREFFRSTTRRDEVIQPLVATNTLFDVDVDARVRGGGVKGQAQAIRHGLAVALQVRHVVCECNACMQRGWSSQKYEPSYREPLRYYDLVTRDSREVERKKPGRAKARKAFQWVKR